MFSINLGDYALMFGIGILLMSLFIMLSSQKNAILGMIGFVIGVIIAFYVENINNFAMAVLQPGIAYIVYGGNLSVMVVSSILMLISMIWIMIVAIINIVLTYGKKAITLWQ